MKLSELGSLLSEKRYDLVETAWNEALEDPAAHGDFFLAACRGLARGAQKSRLQTLATALDTAFRNSGPDPKTAALRWDLLKEAVRAGATPSSPDGFHKLFEGALAAAYPESTSLPTLLGRFKFRETTTPLEGLARLEKVEKWLPFEVGRCFAMAGRGPGKVVETNFALEAVRIDFEKAKGIAIPIGVAAKSLVPLPDGHILRDKLTDPAALAAFVKADPPGALKRLLDSFGRRITLAEAKDAFSGLVDEERWSSWLTAAKRHRQVVVHGTGKTATIEWSDSIESADESLVAKFERGTPREKLDFYRKNAKRSPELAARLVARLAEESKRLRATDPGSAFEIAVSIEKAPGAPEGFTADEMVPPDPLPLLGKLADRVARERLLDLFGQRNPGECPRVLSEWLFREDDARTLDFVERRLFETDPALLERTLDRLLRNPRSGPRAFLWFVQKTETDERARLRLSASVVTRLLDAISWEELGGLKTKVREMFDRTGLVAAWLVKQATLEDARAFLEAMARHYELEPHRRQGLVSAAEMRFPELRKADETEVFWVTPESIEEKRQELDRILKIDIPENTKGIALAAAEGDLSENFEYKARRDKQQLLSARAGQLQQSLERARALDPKAVDPGEVRPGTRLVVTGPAGPRTVTLLGPWDSRPADGVYSYLAGVGKGLLGKRVGDEAEFFGENVVISRIDVWKSA